jgi:hypothetical protein
MYRCGFSRIHGSPGLPEKKDRTFFVYGFAKSDRGNIGQKELRAFKDDAQDQLALTDEQLKVWLENKTLVEVI